MSVEVHHDVKRQKFVTKWGEIDEARPDNLAAVVTWSPQLGDFHLDHVEARHLCLSHTDFIEELLATGEPIYVFGCACTATTEGNRVFLWVEAPNGHWCWEMFPAHWSDGGGPYNQMVGVWRD